MLDCRIKRNHVAGAFYDFLYGFCHPSKIARQKDPRTVANKTTVINKSKTPPLMILTPSLISHQKVGHVPVILILGKPVKNVV